MEILAYLKINTVLACCKQKGFKQALKEHGWRLVLIIFVIYFVRDVNLYLLLPFMLTSWF